MQCGRTRAGTCKSAEGLSPHRRAGQPRKIDKESSLGCDHNEKEAKASFHRSVVNHHLPRGQVISPSTAAGRSHATATAAVQ